MSNPWPIDDSGEPSQIPHGKLPPLCDKQLYD